MISNLLGYFTVENISAIVSAGGVIGGGVFWLLNTYNDAKTKSHRVSMDAAALDTNLLLQANQSLQGEITRVYALVSELHGKLAVTASRCPYTKDGSQCQELKPLTPKS